MTITSFRLCTASALEVRYNINNFNIVVSTKLSCMFTKSETVFQPPEKQTVLPLALNFFLLCIVMQLQGFVRIGEEWSPPIFTAQGVIQDNLVATT